MKIIKTFAFIFGLFILIYLFNRIGFNKIFTTFSLFGPWPVILSIAALFISLLLGAFNIKIILSTIKHIPYLQVFRYVSTTWALSSFTPSKAGDLSMIVFLKTTGMQMGEAIALVFIDRLISLFVFTFFALTGSVYFYFKEYTLLILVFLFLILFIFILFTFSSQFKKINSKIIEKFLHIKIKKFSRTIQKLIKEYPHLLFFDLLITTVQFLIGYLALLLIFRHFGIYISFFHLVTIMSIVRIISLIPITLSGLGVREASAVYFFSTLNISPEIVFSTFLLGLIISYLFSFIFIILNYSLIIDAFQYKKLKS